MKLAGEVTFTMYRNVCNNPLMNEIEKESLIKHPKKRNFHSKVCAAQHTSSSRITLLESTHRIGSGDIESKNSFFLVVVTLSLTSFTTQTHTANDERLLMSLAHSLECC